MYLSFSISVEEEETKSKFKAIFFQVGNAIQLLSSEHVNLPESVTPIFQLKLNLDLIRFSHASLSLGKTPLTLLSRLNRHQKCPIRLMYSLSDDEMLLITLYSDTFN